MKKKGLALLIAVVLVLTCAVGGTLAWLTASSDAVKNTFTTSDINITLKETKSDFKMIPGHTIAKDPKVAVTAGSEECYLFVKLDKSANFDDYLEYAIADGWTELKDVAGMTGIYYRVVKAADMGTEYSVLKNDQVSVKGDVTKEMMETAKTAQPSLTVTAYASQLHKNNTAEFTETEAWYNIPNFQE